MFLFCRICSAESKSLTRTCPRDEKVLSDNQDDPLNEPDRFFVVCQRSLVCHGQGELTPERTDDKMKNYLRRPDGLPEASDSQISRVINQRDALLEKIQEAEEALNALQNEVEVSAYWNL